MGRKLGYGILGAKPRPPLQDIKPGKPVGAPGTTGMDLVLSLRAGRLGNK